MLDWGSLEFNLDPGERVFLSRQNLFHDLSGKPARFTKSVNVRPELTHTFSLAL